MNTVESELTWFKSSYSDTEGGQCIEVAAASTAVHIRDSKAPAGSVVTVSREAWTGFVELTSSEWHV
ncbi:DUF397 domain-containing protein [Streptomyces sp. NPDC001812]|uniref:DUF397 domain-containing protein n=1 Tax=Streptomyces cathayae TaxID=3031124 RepID=A0ABY8JX26_9ACTN|nr:DUF397 domain-containing protein [Streptomyces sp. HUAS 5]WGD40336.1 DUF397 domain-containing protein [Streptomyces sp. HUAS 5]